MELIEHGVVGAWVVVCPLLGGRRGTLDPEGAVGVASQGHTRSGEEEAVRTDDDMSGRFGNLKPRLLRHRPPGTTDRDQAEDPQDDTYNGTQHGDQQTVH